MKFISAYKKSVLLFLIKTGLYPVYYIKLKYFIIGFYLINIFVGEYISAYMNHKL